MPLVDKIKYIGAGGVGFTLKNKTNKYQSSVIQAGGVSGKLQFQLGDDIFDCNVTATRYWPNRSYWYVTNIIREYDGNNNTNSGWMGGDTTSNNKDTVTFTFPIPIDITEVQIWLIASSLYPSDTGELIVSLKDEELGRVNTDKKGSQLILSNMKYPYYYFLKFENGYYTIANGQLTQVVDTSAGGITDLSLITPALLQGVTQPKLVVTSEDETPSGVAISANVKLPPQTIIQKADVDIQSAEELSNIIVTHTGTAIVKISCSIDSGMSWIKYDGSSWVATEFDDGMDIDTIQGLTVEQLDYITQANKVRFAFYIEPQTIDDNIVLQNIKFSMKKEGLWTSCILNTDYTYGRGTDFIEFTAKKAGDYLINYTE